MRISFNEIPGFQVAIKQENDVRDAAFLDLTTDICGIEIRQMTPKDFIILDGVGDPIVNGGIPTSIQLAQFLWLMSIDYRGNSPFRIWRFARRCRKLPYAEAVRRCSSYIDQTFQDSPSSSRGGSRQYAAWCAHLVDSIAREYGWSERDILKTPLKRLFQYLKCIQLWNDPSRPVHNPSDKKVGQFLKLKNARENLLSVLRKRCNERS